MRISVVIPAYNEAKILSRCLESLQAQTRPAFEVIVVDNNSTDATVDIARRLGARVVAEPTQGICAASKAGYDAAQGDIIARCDADSVPPPDWLESIARAFAQDPKLTAVTGPGYFYDAGKLTGFLAQIWYMYAYFLLVGSALARWPLYGSNFAVKRSAWLSVTDNVHTGRLDIHDDMDLTIHLPPSSRIRLDPKLRVGVSARALGRRGMGYRYKRGIVSLTLHWPEYSPWRMWARWITERRRSATGTRHSR